MKHKLKSRHLVVQSAHCTNVPGHGGKWWSQAAKCDGRLRSPRGTSWQGCMSLKGVLLWICTKMLYRLALFAIGRPAATAKSLQSCPTLCDPRDGSPPGSPIPRILQARTLEWVAISFSNAWKWKNKVKSLSCVRLLATPWTATHQAPPSMGFSMQEYWSGLSLPSLLEDLTNHFKNGRMWRNLSLKRIVPLVKNFHNSFH